MSTKATKKKPTVRGLTIALRKATELTRFTKDELAIVRIHNANLEARIEEDEDAQAVQRQLVHDVAEEAKAIKRNLNAAQHDLCRYANATLLERIKFLFKRF